MKKILLSAAALALFAGSASAAVTVRGTVQSYDAASRVITFDNGKTIALPHGVTVPANLASGGDATVLVNENSNEPISVLAR